MGSPLWKSILLLASALVAASGCANGTSTAVVSVTSSGSVSGIDHFSVSLMDQARGRSAGPIEVALAGAPVTIPPPQSFSLVFQPDVSGTLTIDVKAVASDGTALSER